jgi:CRP/FNR family cyclic AMP-dependent transcriptional regulator
MADAPVELLQRVPLFAEFDKGELKRLSHSFKPRTFGPGEAVTTEGMGGAGFFVIQNGEATISVRGQERGKYGPGDYFGEIALIDEGARSATITADTELECYGMTSWEFRPLVEGNASIAWKLLETMAKRLRSAQEN